MLLMTMMLLTTAMQQGGAPSDEGPAADVMLPATDPGSWVTTDDYPPDALDEEREGITGFRLMIEPDGLPRKCEVIAASGHADLDEATCRLLMERARFHPRLDAGGKKVGGSYINRIRWQIPTLVAGFHPDSLRDSWPQAAVPSALMSKLDPADHYPPAALAAREHGSVDMAVSVDVTGKVSGCSVIKSSGSTMLDKASCALMVREGRFEPALDANGKPTKGVVPAQFNWVLPGATSDELDKVQWRTHKFPISKAGVTTLSILLGADGQVTDCQFLDPNEISGVTQWSVCRGYGKRARFYPFVDSDGQPVAKQVTVRTEVTTVDATAKDPKQP